MLKTHVHSDSSFLMLLYRPNKFDMLQCDIKELSCRRMSKYPVRIIISFAEYVVKK
jgi:hypothetical protein